MSTKYFLSRVHGGDLHRLAAFAVIGVTPEVALMFAAVRQSLIGSLGVESASAVSAVIRSSCDVTVLRDIPSVVDASPKKLPVLLGDGFDPAVIPGLSVWRSENPAWRLDIGQDSLRVVVCEKNADKEFISDNLFPVVRKAFKKHK